jgi:hypothetical protein
LSNHDEAPVPISRLEDAVARGIISATQLNAIRALSETEPSGPPAEPSPEARRAFNAVTIAYYVGAAAVVFAFGWFVVDRWDALGAAGVLAIALLYTAIFGLTARFLARLGFQTAAAVATLLTVTMTPLAAWAILDLTGLWYEPGAVAGTYLPRVDLLESLRWIPLELATALAALVALRRVHFAVLAIPVAVALPVVLAQALPLFIDPEIVPEMVNWLAIVSATLVLVGGYWVDQHPRDGEDYARWIYLVALVTLFAGVVGAFPEARYERHGLPALAAGLFALSLFLRRPMFLVFGAIGFVGYLAYLAFDVFRAALSFPIVLATFGIGVIVGTVWLQRRYPALARRVEEHQAGLRAVPHARLVFAGAGIVAMTLFAAQFPGARDRAADRRAQARRSALQVHRARRDAMAHRGSLRAVPEPGSRQP